jgi:hypothetical protein
MLRQAWLPLALISTLGAACGGSPTSPSPPAPRYPSMIGTWSGIEHLFGTLNGTFAEGDCELTWVIGSQINGQFAGTYERSCPTERSSGDVAGNILPNGVLTQHIVIVRSGGANCARTRLDLFEGVVSDASVTIRVSEELTCPGDEGASIIVRERHTSLRKS